jgi:hypothetical protein
MVGPVRYIAGLRDNFKKLAVGSRFYRGKSPALGNSRHLCNAAYTPACRQRSNFCRQKPGPGGRMGLFADSAVHINLNNIDAVHFLPCIPQA